MFFNLIKNDIASGKIDLLNTVAYISPINKYEMMECKKKGLGPDEGIIDFDRFSKPGYYWDGIRSKPKLKNRFEILKGQD